MRVTEFLEKVFALPVSGNAKLVYLYLIGTTQGVTSNANHCREEISFCCGISLIAVRKAIKELTAANLIEVGAPRLGPKTMKAISIIGAEDFMDWWWAYATRK